MKDKAKKGWEWVTQTADKAGDAIEDFGHDTIEVVKDVAEMSKGVILPTNSPFQFKLAVPQLTGKIELEVDIQPAAAFDIPLSPDWLTEVEWTLG